MTALPFTREALGPLIKEGFSISVGEFSYGTPRVLWSPSQKTAYALEIGNYCSIAEGVTIYVGTQGRHPYDFVTTYPLSMIFPPMSMPRKRSKVGSGDLGVRIGSDVWLGRECLIFAGVTIGHGAVVGARALVTADVPPYTIVGGVPAKRIRDRFPPDVVDRLLKLAWWDIDPNLVRTHVLDFLSPDVDVFLDIFERIAFSLKSQHT